MFTESRVVVCERTITLKIGRDCARLSVTLKFQPRFRIKSPQRYRGVVITGCNAGDRSARRDMEDQFRNFALGGSNRNTMDAFNETRRRNVKLGKLRVINWLFLRGVALARLPVDSRFRRRQFDFCDSVARCVGTLHRNSLRRLNIHIKAGHCQVDLMNNPNGRWKVKAGFFVLTGNAHFVLHLDVKRAALARDQLLRVESKSETRSNVPGRYEM